MIIESLGVYLPERLVATADMLRECRRVPTGPFQRLTGIERRPVVGPEEYSIDLARRAIDRCLRLSRHGREAIDLVICCNISRCDGPHHRMSLEPTTSSRLCAEFGFSAADAFDVSNACAGTFTGLWLAQTAFAAGAARRALVVSGEHITHLVATAKREIESLADPRMACLTLGDSGVALLVEADGSSKVGFQAIDLFTRGKYSGLCVGSLTDRPHGGAIMLTHSRQLTEAALEHCVPHAPATLISHDWDPTRVDAFITHQTAKLALDKARAGLNRQLRRPWLCDDNFVSNVRDRGNLATNSHFVALYDRARQGRLHNGQRVVFSIAASGLTGGTALYALDDLPDRLRQKLNGFAPSTGRRPTSVWKPKSNIRITAIGFYPPTGAAASVVEMSAAAARDCLHRSGLAPSDIDVLIYAGVYREKLLSEPAVAAMISGELGIDRADASHRYSKLAFDVSDGAIGLLKACHCAAQILDSGRARRALVIAAERQGDPEVTYAGATAIAATASALLIERSGDHRGGFEAFSFRLFGEFRERRTAYCHRADGSTRLFLEEDAQFAEAADRCAAQGIAELMSAQPGGLDWCLLLGAGGPSVDALLRKLDLPPDRVIKPDRTGGDPFTSSFARAFGLLEQMPKRRAGERILAVHIGSGLRLACVTYLA